MVTVFVGGEHGGVCGCVWVLEIHACYYQGFLAHFSLDMRFLNGIKKNLKYVMFM